MRSNSVFTVHKYCYLIEQLTLSITVQERACLLSHRLYVGEVGCTIFSFICLSTEAIEWQPCFFVTILLLYAPPKTTSMLVLFVVLGVYLLIYCYIGRPS